MDFKPLCVMCWQSYPFPRLKDEMIIALHVCAFVEISVKALMFIELLRSFTPSTDSITSR